MIVKFLLPKENFFAFKNAKGMSQDESKKELSEINRIIEQCK